MGDSNAQRRFKEGDIDRNEQKLSWLLQDLVVYGVHPICLIICQSSANAFHRKSWGMCMHTCVHMCICHVHACMCSNFSLLYSPKHELSP